MSKNQDIRLEVKERPEVGVFVKDLSTYVVNNAEDMERIMIMGNKNSKQANPVKPSSTHDASS